MDLARIVLHSHSDSVKMLEQNYTAIYGNGFLLTTHESRINAHFWLFLCGIRLMVGVTVRVRLNGTCNQIGISGLHVFNIICT